MKLKGRLRWYAGPILYAGLVVVNACSVLSPRPEPSKFFVLTALPREQATAARPAVADGSDKLSIGLGPVNLPAYLKRAELVTRVASNRMQLSETDRWAEPLDENFRRVLAENLSMLLGTRQIVSFPWYSSTVFDYQVQVDVERFERTGSGDARLMAQWTIRDGKGNKVLASQESDLSASAGASDAEAAAALSADLGNLSRRIASAIQQLQDQRRLAGHNHGLS